MMTVNGKATSRAAPIFSSTWSAALRSSSLSGFARTAPTACWKRSRTPSMLVTNPSQAVPGSTARPSSGISIVTVVTVSYTNMTLPTNAKV